ncbi:hypothetical protein [Nonomuraea dietziae]|uniref:Uncharacterized protein n=1 Tax=Nonomuraea dietziae TaxID=65515 RepID=A0A7W5Y847_9ACTN|nr:hypothetical protein [Nonomuraea dietziae]MBB3728271.1 hypothetical protein [Nonomuraea dietziae]
MNDTSTAFAVGEGTAVTASPGDSVLAGSPGLPGAITGAVESAVGAAVLLSPLQPERATTVQVMTTSAART